MANLDLKLLDEAYKTLWDGDYVPSFMLIRCGECNDTFIIGTRKRNKKQQPLCSHLQEILRCRSTIPTP